MAGAKKNDVRYLDLSKNRINADHLVDDPDLQGKITEIRRLFPQTKKDVIAKVLLCCDNNLDSAVAKLSSGESMKEALGEWEVAKGKGRGKTTASSGSKRSKKGSVQVLNGNGASAEVPSVPLSNGVCESDGEEGKRNGHPTGAPSRSVSTSPVAGAPRTGTTQSARDLQQKSSASQPSPLPQRTRKRRGMQAAGTSTQQSSGGSDHVSGDSSASSSSSKQQDAASNRPAETTPTVAQPVEMQKEPSSHKESGKKNEEPPPSKPVESPAVSSAQSDRGRLDSAASTSSVGAAGGDSVKRLLKDITRCHVSLARHQANLQERCDVSSRLLHQTFAQLRAAVDQREECLLEQLEKVRSSAAKMLEERQETSAHLKVLGEGLLSHSREHDSNHIRAQMKAFVSDRKVDEEIGSVSRFQADPDQLIQQISTFGKINSISHTYTAWCAGQVIVSPALITSVSTGPIPQPASTAATPAETDPVSVARSTGMEDGRKQMEQEKATKQTAVSKLQQQQQQHPTRKGATPPPPPEPCSPNELLARQERVKASLLAQGVILYPPMGEMVPSKKSVRRDRKRHSAQRTQESGPGVESNVKETVNPPNTKPQRSTNDKPASAASEPQVGDKLECPSTVSAPTEKANEKKGGGLATGQGSKVILSRDNQKATSAPQSRSKPGAHYEQSVIIVHNRNRGGRGQRSQQQPKPVPDGNRGVQARQPREDRRRGARASKQQPATSKSLPPATNGTEGRPTEVERPKKKQEAVIQGDQQEAVIPEEKSDPGNKPKAGSATSLCSPLVGQTAPEHADLPGLEGKAGREIQSEEIAFMDASTSSAEPGSEKQQKPTRKQSVRVTPSPDHSDTPLFGEDEPEEVFQLKTDLTSEPEVGEK